jgi:hypothetical protein
MRGFADRGHLGGISKIDSNFTKALIGYRPDTYQLVRLARREVSSSFFRPPR